MEYSQDNDILSRRPQIRNPIVTVKEDPDFTLRFSSISVTCLGKCQQYLRFLKYTVDYFFGRLWILFSNIIVDVS